MGAVWVAFADAEAAPEGVVEPELLAEAMGEGVDEPEGPALPDCTAVDDAHALVVPEEVSVADGDGIAVALAVAEGVRHTVSAVALQADTTMPPQGAQGAQAAARGNAEKAPAAHPVHWAAPVERLLKAPAAHGRHAPELLAAARALYVPTPQAVQATEPLTLV